MLKFVIIIVAGFILFKLLTNDKKKKSKNKQAEMEKMAADGVMVKDPICGTFVPKDSDIRVRKGEKILNFCSFECRDKYLEQLESESASSIEQ